MALIIVESPTKARTFNRILKQSGRDKDFFVYATMGHIRDLPGNAMSIDFDNQFEPKYQIIPKKEKVVEQLKSLHEKNDEIILATDMDREGESISYHAAYLLGFIDEKWPNITLKKKNSAKLSRIVFHEITAHALDEALENRQELRLSLVKAQQARRILDRIVGYDLSPLLWKKMGKNWLSAGRVQTVALRLIVEREKEIRLFSIEDYVQIYGHFSFKKTAKDPLDIRAKLLKKDDIPYEQKYKLTLFDGEYEYTKTNINAATADAIKKELEADTYTIEHVTEEKKLRYPPPPYTTSLLQQDAFQRYSFSSKQTMRLAQDLYERGYITYHRTDSFNLSTQFVFKAMKQITDTYGKEYALDKPRGYKTKSKMAQEAHEAIRPTKVERTALEVTDDSKITQNHKRLYALIYNRALATQMKEAEIKTIKIDIRSNKGYSFESEYELVLFDGFLRVANPDYVENHKTVPEIHAHDPITLGTIELQENKTKPPYRYNDASLIKTMEEKGIGRPSTYAPIISLIQDKNYVEKQGRYFNPTKLGEAISDYLSVAFPTLFNLDFTATMEDSLDKVASGEEDMIALLKNFYEPFHKNLEEKKDDKEFIDVEDTIDEKCPKCGKNLAVRFSKFGKFLACSGYPECKFTKPFLFYVNNKFCPLDNGRLTVRFSKSKKRFYGCENYPTCKYSTWTLAAIGKPAATTTKKTENKKKVSKKPTKKK